MANAEAPISGVLPLGAEGRPGGPTPAAPLGPMAPMAPPALPFDADLLAGGATTVPAELEPGGTPVFDLVRLAERARRWGGILAVFFTAQAATQAAGLAAGLLFVNFLPVEEFAFYTLASSILVTLSFASDLGSSSALLHFFHRTQCEGGEFATFAAAVVSLRRRLFALGAPVAIALLVLWGSRRGVTPAVLAIAAGLVLAAAWFQIGGVVAVLRLRLEDRYGASYRAEIAGALTRLALAALAIALGWRLAGPALATAVAAALVTAVLAGRALSRSGSTADEAIPEALRGSAVRNAGAAAAGVAPQLGLAVQGPALAAARRQVLRYLAPTLPGALYFAVQGQFVVWLAATFGGTQNLAEVGALGRLGLIVGLFSGLSGVVFLPRLVRLTDERTFRARYLQFGAFLIAIAGVLLLAAWLAPRAFLFLLGGSYRGLDRELLLVVATSGLTLLGGYAVGVNSARSWNRWQVGAVAFLIVCQVALALALPLNTTLGALAFGFGSGLAGFVAQLTITSIGFLRPRWVTW